MHTKQNASFIRRLTVLVWWLVAAIMVAALLFPIRFGALRLLLVCGWCFLFVGGTALLWRYRSARILASTILVLTGLTILGPGRALDSYALRNDYVVALRNYQGSPYLWGGECRRGIDCSGLVRRALIDASLRQGITRCNPSGVRAALESWYFDSSAKAMGEDYRGRTQITLESPSLNFLAASADVARLRAGDFAVTRSGVHTLAYLGEGEWIQADPGAGKVIIMRTPSNNAWFSQPMKIVRWTLLDD